MVVELARRIDYGDESIPQYHRVPEFKDRVNGFFWMACCSSSEQINSESWEAGYDLENCSRIDIFPEWDKLAHLDVSVYPSPGFSPKEHYQVTYAQEKKAALLPIFVNRKSPVAHRSLFENDQPSENLNTTPIVIMSDNPLDGVVDTHIHWEVSISEGWQTYVPKISEGIEKLYQKITPQDVEKVEENNKSNWWCDSRFGNKFIYRYRHYQFSPLFMLQRDTTTGSISNIRRRKVELHSHGFSLKHLRLRSSWEGIGGVCSPVSEKQHNLKTPDQSEANDESLIVNHFIQKKEKPKKQMIYKKNDLDSRSKRSTKEGKKYSDNPSISKKSEADVIYKNWKMWGTSQIVALLRIMNFHQYCDAVERIGITGNELAQVGKTYLINELEMTPSHATRFLSAFRKIQNNSDNQLVAATSVNSSHLSPPVSDKKKPGSQKTKDDSCSRDCCFPASEVSCSRDHLGRASRTSIVLQYSDHDASESSVLSTLSGEPPRQRLKSAGSGSPFSKSRQLVQCKDTHGRDIWKKTIHSRHKYSLESLTKTDIEDSSPCSQWQGYYGGNDHTFLNDGLLPDDDNIVQLSIPELKFSNDEEKVGHRVPFNYQLTTTDDEKMQNESYEGETSAICGSATSRDDSVSEDSNECYKEPPKFVLSEGRNVHNVREEEDLTGKKFNKRLTERTRSIPKFESTTSPSQSEEVLGKTPVTVNHMIFNPSGRSGFIERRDKRETNNNYGLLKDDTTLSPVRSTKKRLNDFPDLDDDIKTLFQELEATTINFKTSIPNATVGNSRSVGKQNDRGEVTAM